MPLRISLLTFFTFEINSAVDKGKHISVKDMKKLIEDKQLFTFLEKKLGADIDLSLLSEAQKGELLDYFLDFSEAVNERKKFGITKNGLCLLIAYAQEIIQQIKSAGTNKV